MLLLLFFLVSLAGHVLWHCFLLPCNICCSLLFFLVSLAGHVLWHCFLLPCNVWYCYFSSWCHWQAMLCGIDFCCLVTSVVVYFSSWCHWQAMFCGIAFSYIVTSVVVYFFLVSLASHVMWHRFLLRCNVCCSLLFFLVSLVGHVLWHCFF